MKYVYWPAGAADILIITLYRPKSAAEAIVATVWVVLPFQAVLSKAQLPVESPSYSNNNT